MHSQGINGEGELSGQPANPGSPGKMAVKTECVCGCNLLLWPQAQHKTDVHKVKYMESM